MPATAKTKTAKFTVAEYFAREVRSDVKHEFWRGRIRPMPGATERHCTINVNFSGEARQAFKDTDCRVWSPDLRLRTAPNGLYTYPDAALVRGAPKFAEHPGLDSQTLINPTALVEVLSKSTERRDRGFKFRLYQTLPTLREYVLIDQRQPRVEVFARQPNDTWNLNTVEGMEAALELSSVPLRLPLAELYRNVAFPATRKRAGNDA